MSALHQGICDAVLEALRRPEARAILREAVAEALATNDAAQIDIDEASRITGRTVPAIYKAVSRGTFPGVVRNGGTLRFKKSALICGAKAGG